MTWAQAGCNGAFPAKLSDDQLMISWISADRPVMPFVRPASADIIPGNSHAIQLLKIINFFYKKKKMNKNEMTCTTNGKEPSTQIQTYRILTKYIKNLTRKIKSLKNLTAFFSYFFFVKYTFIDDFGFWIRWIIIHNNNTTTLRI